MAALVEVEVRSRHLPPIRWNSEPDTSAGPSGGGGGGGGPGLGKMLARWVRPAVTVKTPLGTWSRAPYGEPGETTWPMLGFVLVVAAVAVVGFAVVGVVASVRALAK